MKALLILFALTGGLFAAQLGNPGAMARTSKAAAGGGGGTTNTWITGYTSAGGANFDSQVGGMFVVTNNTQITVRSLGWFAHSGSFNPLMKVRLSDFNSNTLAEVTVSVTAADGAFHYALTNVVLAAGSTNYINGVDTELSDQNAIPTASSYGKILDATYSYFGLQGFGVGHMTVGPNFTFTAP